ncbi:hypothetical protein HanXRQr2_Chr15g0690861 [Helianthus annuus]|uniref:Uncharacterized protein n=1 Tax=Helianthus annuus TaxID=4232 RepID=A0A9K3H1Z0_HELAN|nr:hypothetical protein HanXRQr2_Chr15g0690861 [Helianthus annuus]KAJ0831064.1 hypothetical protein HanPSC8_Chr15g0662701 [Helianthus annuus]
MTFSCFILASIFLTYFVEDTKKPKVFLNRDQQRLNNRTDNWTNKIHFPKLQFNRE